jgi:hypothetical protein
MPKKRKTVFISYSHKDRKWADELQQYMAPWIRDDRLSLWDDSQIQVGTEWMDEIKKALEEATVAVPLVTQHLLASQFIAEHELPTIIDRANQKTLRLAWIAVSASTFEMTGLSSFQALNDPSRPLDSLAAPARKKALVSIAKSIADAATISTLAGGLHIIDETTESLEAALEGRQERKDRRFGVQASYSPAADRISFSGARQTITVEDLQRLPDDDREFIADLEDSLTRNYGRWKAVRSQLGDAGGALDGEVESQLNRIAKLMCRDLNSILDFLRKMHKAELEDHYGRYRYICQRLENV